MADKKPATVTLKKLKGTTYVISAFYNVAAKETIFDKLEHIADRDVNASVPVTKNQHFKVLKHFQRRTGCGIINSLTRVF